jgi:hypothetical protein
MCSALKLVVIVDSYADNIVVIRHVGVASTHDLFV